MNKANSLDGTGSRGTGESAKRADVYAKRSTDFQKWRAKCCEKKNSKDMAWEAAAEEPLPFDNSFTSFPFFVEAHGGGGSVAGAYGRDCRITEPICNYGAGRAPVVAAAVDGFSNQKKQRADTARLAQEKEEEE
jgi:hypothetical protein